MSSRTESPSNNRSGRTRRATIACAKCRNRKVKCVRLDNDPYSRAKCKRCNEKHLDCEYVSVQEQEYQQDASVSPVIPQEYLPSSGYGYPVEEGQGMSSYTGMPAYDMGVAYNQAGAHSTYASPSPDPYAQQRMRRVGPSPPLDSFPTPPPSHGMAMGMPTEPYSAYDPYGQAPPEQYGSHPGYYQGQGGAGYPKPSPPGHATPPDMSYRQHQSMSFSCYCDYSRGYVCEQHRH